MKTAAPERLTSWKEIAEYLGTSVRTVARWERTEGLPVHRHEHASGGGTVYAFTREVEAWRESRSRRPGRRRRLLVGAAGLVLVLSVVLALTTAILRKKSLHTGAPPYSRLAVLPLAALSPDSEDGAFADGITDELITQLARIKSLTVISRTSVMRYRESKRPLPEIGRELTVDAIVEGTVQRWGGRVRITAQLIDAASDKHLWGGSYERDLKDVLALQDDVARAIAREIRIEVTPPERSRLSRNRPVDPEAYQAYLKGRLAAGTPNRTNEAKAVEHLEEATRKDPGYAPAWAQLAHALMMFEYWDDSPAGERSVAAANRALELDDSLAEAHVNLGDVKFFHDWDWYGGEAEFRRAVELDPGSPDAQGHYATCLWILGRRDAALAHFERARELDPFSPATNFFLGSFLAYIGRHEAALEGYRRAIESDANYAQAYIGIGSVYEELGRFDEAISAYLRAATLNGNSPDEVKGLEAAFRNRGIDAFYRDLGAGILARLNERAKHRHVPPTNFAGQYAAMGDKDQALKWLEEAHRQRSQHLAWITVAREWKRLRSEPRFQELVRRMQFPE